MPAPEDDLKRRARRRLIGAVALTLTAVIVLPLLLEDEPPPAGRLEVDMPAVAVPQPPAPRPAAPAPDEKVPVAAAQTENARVAPAPHEAAPLASAPVASGPAATASAPAGTDRATPAHAAVSDPQTGSKKPPTTVNSSHATESKKGAEFAQAEPLFVVQLGAFSEVEKVSGLRARAATLGLSSYTDKSGALTRVRVGPFPTREAATAAAIKLAAAGLGGQVMPK